MDWIDGEPLEALTSEAVPQARRNAAARLLQEIMFREIFEFRFVQSDPNIANFLHLPATQQLALLDLGSTVQFPAELVEIYRRICRAVIAGDDSAIRAAAIEIGYVRADDPEPMIRNAVDIIGLACEPLTQHGPFDFAGSRLVLRIRDRGIEAAFSGGLRSPPPQTMFLHRKLIGTFLVCARLRSHVNVHALVRRFL
jgi:predicted unusual protein kinase regulating ubiquinone biosynthesis (AarF/ABC1/UbiB family)